MSELKIYEVEYNGQIYEVEAADGTPEEDIFSSIESYKPETPAQAAPAPVSNAPAPAQREVLPNAIQDANRTTTVPTKAWEEVPGAAEYAEELFWKGTPYSEAAKAFNQKYPDLEFSREQVDPATGKVWKGPELWAEHLTRARTPEGRNFYQNNGVFAPINRATGVEDPEAPDSVLEEALVSGARSIYNTANTVRGAAALGADLIGQDEAAEKMLDEYMEQQAAIGLNFPTSSGQFVDIGSFGDAGRWAASTLGELLPQVAVSLGVGGVAGAAAKKVAERRVAGLIESEMAKGATQEAAEAAAAKMVQKMALRGQIGGAGAVSEVQEVGSVYGDTYGKTGERKPWESLAAGTAAAALDTILPARVFSKIGGAKARDAFTEAGIKRFGKEAFMGMLTEGGTEFVQTIIEQLPSGEVDWDEVIEAGFRGAFGGSVVGGSVAGYQGIQERQAAKDRPAPPPEPVGGPAVAVPTETKRRTKAYREQIAQSTNQVVERINSLTESWENAPTFEVYDNLNNIKGADRNAIGAIQDGKVLISTENVLATAKARNVAPEVIVNAVTFHEGLGHHGLAQLFGDRLDAQLATILDQSSLYRRRVDEWLAKNPKAYEGENNRDLLAFEEILAEQSEKGQMPVTLINSFKNSIKEFGRRMGLNLEYSTREVETILGMAHSAVINGKGRDVASNGFRFMYAGSKAKTAEPISRGIARLSEMRGADVGPKSTVRKATGWFKGPDGKWRFEISDKEAKAHALDASDIQDLVNELDDFGDANPDDIRGWQYSSGLDFLREEHAETTSLYLYQVLDHPELFKAYPELKEILVYRKNAEVKEPELLQVQGMFDPGRGPKGVIYINSTLDEDKAMSTLLHEVQHAVQEIEDFARGGNPQSAVGAMTNDHVSSTAKNYLRWVKARRSNDKKTLQALKFAHKDPDAREMVEMEKRYHEYEEYLQTPPNYDDDLEMWVREGAEKEQKEAELNQFLAEQRFLKKLGLSREDLTVQEEGELDQIYEFLSWPEDVQLMQLNAQEKELEYANTFVDKISKGLKENNVKLLRKALRADDNVNFQAYESLFGEVEARDVQQRQMLDDEQRKRTDPYELEGVVNPEEYVMEYGLTGSSNRYMMMSSNDKVEMTPEEIAAMPPEDIFEAENAMTILGKLTEGYTPIVLTLDDIQREAELRGFTASELLRQKEIAPGELARRLFQYDIVADKLNERVTTLFEKMQNGTATAADRASHAKALFTMQEVTEKIFGLQGELGRALSATRNINFTRRRVKGVMETVAQFKKGSPFEVLNDPDEYFKYAQTIQQQIEESKEKMKQAGGRAMANALNLPRALMSTADLSAPLRQGLFMIHKPQWWTSFFHMFRYFGNERAYQDLMEDITTRSTYGEMLAANLALSNIDGKPTQREEDFQTEWAQKLPILGRLVRMSERAYSGFLNKLRADVFDQLLAKLPDGYTQKDLRDIGRFINAATGRGNLPDGSGLFLPDMRGAGPLLNGMFFSPRLIASRVVMTTALVDYRTYTTMNKQVRNEYIKSILSVGSLALMVLSLAVLAGADVEEDPRSTDFGKIKVDNVRYDILGGEGQYITLAARVAMNATKTADGDIKPYGNKFGQSTRLDAIEKFFYNKFSPVASFVLDYTRGEDAIGRPFEADRAIATRFVPMFTQDVYENMQEEGVAKGAAMSVPAAFGVGVQSYKSYSLDTERELLPPDDFDMKSAIDGEYSNAEVKDGTVYLNDHAKEQWGRLLNSYYEQYMAEEQADPAWQGLTDDEKRDVIKAVRNDARKDAKADMLEFLEIEEE